MPGFDRLRRASIASPQVSPEVRMSVKINDSDSPARFNYLVCLDLIVVACILVVAGRTDGLAITVSAIIIAGAAVIYRCAVGVKSHMSARPAQPHADPGQVERDFVAPTPVESPIVARSRSKSWLRDGD
ncbi:hypothetical protein [Massilia orientalis]|uniref:Uncharacterized protein n=1 Tax=Massilia orientalis TaxID=3050128 RepID=A0ACC7M5E9_9BURK|nr:hypothetical protein [Massilia sp. YIM B02787]